MTHEYKDTTEEVDAAMKIICDPLVPLAEKMAETTGRPVLGCLVSLLRPLAQRALYGAQTASSPVEKAFDNRTRAWEVNMRFWDVTQGFERGDILAETEPEIINGLRDVTDAFLDYAADVHGEDVQDKAQGIAQVDLDRKVRTLRTEVSRNGGHAIMRINYSIGEEQFYYCTVSVTRYDKPLDTV